MLEFNTSLPSFAFQKGCLSGKEKNGIAVSKHYPAVPYEGTCSYMGTSSTLCIMK